MKYFSVFYLFFVIFFSFKEITYAYTNDNSIAVYLKLNDTVFCPSKIEVPCGRRIKLFIKNIGKNVAEFESLQLRKEKILIPGTESYIVIAPLKVGRYKFFNDFNHTINGVIIAK